MSMEIKNPKFSIIIPVYNVEKYLNQCLDSVFAQTFTDFEVICVNDGSTDGSLKILEEYKIDDRLVIINCTNGGTASARNTGIDAAKGEYIWFVDSDDWIETNALEILNNKVLECKTDVLGFNGKLKYEEDEREDADKGFSEDNLTGWEYYNKYALVRRKFHFVCVVLRIYNREFLKKNKLYFQQNILHEDNLWIPYVFYYAKQVSVVNDILYIYRIRTGSKMQTVNLKKLFDIVHVANQLSTFFIRKDDIDKSVVYREISGEFFKGFMSAQIKVYGNHDSELSKIIDWQNFEKVAIYPRHKRMFVLLKISPMLLRLYVRIELYVKKFIN